MKEVLKIDTSVNPNCLFYCDNISYIKNIKQLTHQKVKRKYLLAVKPLPGMSKFTSAVIYFDVEKGPIEISIPAITVGTEALSSECAKAKQVKYADTIYMMLAGIVNPGVNGGVANYKVQCFIWKKKVDRINLYKVEKVQLEKNRGDH